MRGRHRGQRYVEESSAQTSPSSGGSSTAAPQPQPVQQSVQAEPPSPKHQHSNSNTSTYDSDSDRSIEHDGGEDSSQNRKRGSRRTSQRRRRVASSQILRSADADEILSDDDIATIQDARSVPEMSGGDDAPTVAAASRTRRDSNSRQQNRPKNQREKKEQKYVEDSSVHQPQQAAEDAAALAPSNGMQSTAQTSQPKHKKKAIKYVVVGEEETKTQHSSVIAAPDSAPQPQQAQPIAQKDASMQEISSSGEIASVDSVYKQEKKNREGRGRLRPSRDEPSALMASVSATPSAPDSPSRKARRSRREQDPSDGRQPLLQLHTVSAQMSSDRVLPKRDMRYSAQRQQWQHNEGASDQYWTGGPLYHHGYGNIMHSNLPVGIVPVDLMEYPEGQGNHQQHHALHRSFKSRQHHNAPKENAHQNHRESQTQQGSGLSPGTQMAPVQLAGAPQPAPKAAAAPVVLKSASIKFNVNAKEFTPTVAGNS